MPTSSIYEKLVIRGEEVAKQFANAMEACEKASEWTPKTKMPPCYLLTKQFGYSSLWGNNLNESIYRCEYSGYD